eukprot:564455_1
MKKKKQNNNQQENVNNINENHHKIEQKNDNDNDGYAGFKEPQRHMVNVEQNNNDQIGIKPSLTTVADPLERQQIHDEIKNEMEDIMEVDDDKKQENDNDNDDLFEDTEDNNNDSIQWSTANIKILFSTQQTSIRFKPSYMIKLWKLYFIEDDKQLLLNAE